MKTVVQNFEARAEAVEGVRTPEFDESKKDWRAFDAWLKDWFSQRNENCGAEL